jgi:hypothetical protein
LRCEELVEHLIPFVAKLSFFSLALLVRDGGLTGPPLSAPFSRGGSDIATALPVAVGRGDEALREGRVASALALDRRRVSRALTGIRELRVPVVAGQAGPSLVHLRSLQTVGVWRRRLP